MSNPSDALENNEDLKDHIYTALNKSFEGINDNVEMFDYNKRFESGLEQLTKPKRSSLNEGIQNLLILLFLNFARELGIKPDDLEKIFEEVIKTLDKYKNKKAEV